MRKNTAALWDQYWEKEVPVEKDIFALAYEECTISWQQIEKAILAQFGSFAGLKVVEIGAGAGTNSGLMAKRHAAVTVIDYSDAALNRSHEFFTHNGLFAEFVKQDVFTLPEGMLNNYDVSMSYGFAEHFKGHDRLRVFKSHFDLINKGGMAVIAVPNKYNLPYRVFKLVAERLNRWLVGEEYPFSRKELSDLCRKIEIKDYHIYGDSFVSSFSFLDPLKRDFVRRSLHLGNYYQVSRLRRQKVSFLDKWFGYALILCAGK